MIQPAYGKSLKYRPSQRSFVIYYVVAFILSLTNFIPVLSVGPLISHAKVEQNTENFMNVCYLMSLPLLFEFTLDTIAAQFQALSVLKDLEHRFGHGLLLFSLFLVVFLVSGNQMEHTSAFVVNCVFALLQSLVITGVYGKLQAHGNGHWSVRSSWLVLLFFVLSEISTRFGMLYHSRNALSYTICVSFAFAYMVICLLIHLYFSKKFLHHFLGIKWGATIPPGPAGIDDIVCLILQAILTIYLLVSIFSNGYFLLWGYQLNEYTNLEILKQLVLALCASILPGRMIRRSFILLRHEMDTKESFVRYVSHEIRSPLSTTSLGLDYLIERMNSTINMEKKRVSGSGSDSLTMTEALDLVMESKVTCELAMNTLNDFLMLDKIQSNMLQISTMECAAGDFMLNTVKSFRLQALTNEVTLKCTSQVIDDVDIMTLPITVDVDQYKTNQVIRNLFSNALKFTPAGGTIEVTMSLRNAFSGEELESLSDLAANREGKGCFVRYAVKDSGCGISKENLPKLFGQYVQFNADKLQGGKGSGLGLWLSKAIVEMHGGRIGATSEGEGKGCTFWFELPCEVAYLRRSDKSSGTAVSGKAIAGPTVRVSSCGELDDLAGESVRDAVTQQVPLSPDSHGEGTAAGGPTAAAAAAAAAAVTKVTASSALFHFRKRSEDYQHSPAASSVSEEVLRVFDIENQQHRAQGTPPQRERQSSAAALLAAATGGSAGPSRPSPGPPPSHPHLQNSPRLHKTDTASNVAAWLSTGFSPAYQARKTAFVTARTHTYSHIHEEPRHPVVDHSSAVDRDAAGAETTLLPRHYTPPQGLRVLLVDDSSIARKMVERQLNKIGAVCTHAVNGREAVDKVRESLVEASDAAATGAAAAAKYDVILMDYHMPEMTGPAAIVAIRALGYAGIILAVSGMTSEDGEFTQLLNANQIDRIMLKPFSLKIFTNILSDVMIVGVN